jgi:hypothetical protein
LDRLARHALLSLGLIVSITLAGARPAEARGAARDPFAVATAALVGNHSEKVRAQAALVLGRNHDSRATPYLIRALGDPSPAVRAMAAKVLGDLGDDVARAPLETAAGDKNPLVRRHAAAALEALTEHAADSTIAVKPMGDVTHKASPALRDQMRRFVATELQGFKKRAPGGYAVDGSIKALGMSTHADQIEVRCAIELVLSTGRGSAIIMMSSGEAIVQRRKKQFRPAMQPQMEEEALEHAVRGASDGLRQHFAANGP